MFNASYPGRAAIQEMDKPSLRLDRINRRKRLFRAEKMMPNGIAKHYSEVLFFLPGESSNSLIQT